MKFIGIDLQPEDAVLYRLRGRCYQLLNKQKEAKEDFSHASSLMIDDRTRAILKTRRLLTLPPPPEMPKFFQENPNVQRPGISQSLYREERDKFKLIQQEYPLLRRGEMRNIRPPKPLDSSSPSLPWNN